MNIQIITDSTSDIPQHVLNTLPITVVPVYLNINGESLLDNIQISRDEFYKALPDYDPYPTTAAPSPDQFLKVYEQAADNGATAIFSIHITASFSAIYQSAKVAAEQFSRVPVHVIDSGNLSLAEGLVVIAAARAAKAGKTEDEVKEMIESAILRAHAFAKLDTIEYLRRSGRMSSIQYSVVSLLGIKPILKMNDHVSRMEIARTLNKAFDRVVHTAVEVFQHAEIFGITHAGVQAQVEELVQKLKSLFPLMPEPIISEVTPVLGVHVGPGALCINWLESQAYFDSKRKGFLKWFS